MRGLLGVELRGSGSLIIGHFLGVAIFGLLSGGRNRDELCTHRFDLFTGFRAQVCCLDNRAHRVGGTDCGKSADTSADDVNGSWRHLACGSHLTSEKATIRSSRFDYCAVTTDVGHRRQHVHRLCPGNTGNRIHSKGSDVAVRELFDQLFVTPWRKSANQHGTVVKQCTELFRRSVERYDDIAVPDRLVDNGGAGGFVVRVGELSSQAGVSLHGDLVAKLDEFADGLRGRSHNCLLGIGF